MQILFYHIQRRINKKYNDYKTRFIHLHALALHRQRVIKIPTLARPSAVGDVHTCFDSEEVVSRRVLGVLHPAKGMLPTPAGRERPNHQCA